MKIYLQERSYFTFRGKESFELEILGKSVSELMRERLGATACAAPPDGEKIVLDAVYPLLTRSGLEELLDSEGGSFSFVGGRVDRGGECRKTERELGAGLFSLSDYAEILRLANEERRRELSERGVFMEKGAEVDYSAVIGEGVVLGCGARVRGNSVIGRNAVIGSGSEITDSTVGENTKIKNSVLLSSAVGSNCEVGPFAYLRPHSEVGDGCRIGDFVELKNAKIGAGTKAAHLAYVGDAEVGERVNIGCGVVFANFNGKTKSKTRVGSDAFIGSNCNLIAPVTVGEGVFLAAGTTLTCNLSEGDFCVGRCRETVKPNRASRYLK